MVVVVTGARGVAEGGVGGRTPSLVKTAGDDHPKKLDISVSFFLKR